MSATGGCIVVLILIAAGIVLGFRKKLPGDDRDEHENGGP